MSANKLHMRHLERTFSQIARRYRFLCVCIGSAISVTKPYGLPDVVTSDGGGGNHVSAELTRGLKASGEVKYLSLDLISRVFSLIMSSNPPKNRSTPLLCCLVFPMTLLLHASSVSPEPSTAS
ncbi:hypothetical protein J5N97_004051 [Dioscorea zingiberensis]|uniref:Uncharacterized protein n=1 Tax=Dioscorea zingiberensis TaxID=325984 RepID=A0A9D5D5E0_9LILI|nr:hypothetical protein J5N97_004042 [Dioscorea zingiberensis]KAJ0985695.1 hypothetical protein J5N97_004051 [Dioscorea zingiberensis]